MSPLPSAAEPQLDLTGKTIAGFFAGGFLTAVPTIFICLAKLGAF